MNSVKERIMKTKQAHNKKKAKIIPINSASTPSGKTNVGTPASKTSTPVTPQQQPVITHEMIALRAWSIWKSKGCKPGQDEMNWYQAELELKNAHLRKGAMYEDD